uniref:Uncharacterized protein n=1 Tax=Pithovirus LCPAC201 TaxID=2506591 RepID=A0A481Z627_9VIRU|nr:MAG: hypothetical protein LCPAC201_01530 [Pithovirus LCPAC201]
MISVRSPNLSSNSLDISDAILRFRAKQAFLAENPSAYEPNIKVVSSSLKSLDFKSRLLSDTTKLYPADGSSSFKPREPRPKSFVFESRPLSDTTKLYPVDGSIMDSLNPRSTPSRSDGKVSCGKPRPLSDTTKLYPVDGRESYQGIDNEESLSEENASRSLIMAKNGINQFLISDTDILPELGQNDPITISTMTAVVILDGMVDYVKAFPLLRITRPKDQNELDLIKTNNVHLLPANQRARVIYAKYKGNIRGIISRKITKSKKPNLTFANSITISLKLDITGLTSDKERPPKNTSIITNTDTDISETKDINLKLSSGKIQMCGAKSRKMAMTAAQHIVDNLIEVEILLRWIDKNMEHAKITAAWVLSVVQGGLFLDLNNPTVVGIKSKKLCQNEVPTIPENIYSPLAKYLIGLAWDFAEYNLFRQNLYWLLTVKHIIRPTESSNIYLRPSKVITAMVNFNYPLGFRVRRMALCKIIEKFRPGCRARYNNQYDSHVRIYYPCLSEEHPNQVKYSTLIVYSTGHVTQSGPNPEIGYRVHHAFMKLANQIRPQIDMTPLKYNPTQK